MPCVSSAFCQIKTTRYIRPNTLMLNWSRPDSNLSGIRYYTILNATIFLKQSTDGMDEVPQLSSRSIRSSHVLFCFGNKLRNRHLSAKGCGAPHRLKWTNRIVGTEHIPLFTGIWNKS